MATTSIALGSTKVGTLQLKYSAYRFRPYMWELEAACLAHPHANLVLTGKDPIAKFLRRNRKLKRFIPIKKRPSKEDVFNDPRKTCAQYIDTLEELLDETMTGESEDELGDTEEEKTEEQVAAERSARTLPGSRVDPVRA